MQWKDSVYFLLTTSQHTVFQCLSGKLAPYDITPSQYGVLRCLWAGGGVCLPRQIAAQLFLETSTVSGILDRMEKKGLIGRKINPRSRREVLVFITEKGEALQAPLREVADALNDEILNVFTDEERVFLKEALLRIAEKGKF